MAGNTATKQSGALEKMFHMKEIGTNTKTEVMAGFTTFMTMAYILAVNPSILSNAGMDPTAILIATCLASCFGTLCMAFMANYPFALAPGMGLNAFFAFTVCGNMGYSWQVALAAVFIEGIIFIVLYFDEVFNCADVKSLDDLNFRKLCSDSSYGVYTFCSVQLKIA